MDFKSCKYPNINNIRQLPSTLYNKANIPKEGPYTSLLY